MMGGSDHRWVATVIVLTADNNDVDLVKTRVELYILHDC